MAVFFLVYREEWFRMLPMVNGTRGVGGAWARAWRSCTLCSVPKWEGGKGLAWRVTAPDPTLGTRDAKANPTGGHGVSPV